MNDDDNTQPLPTQMQQPQHRSQHRLTMTDRRFYAVLVWTFFVLVLLAGTIMELAK